MDLRIGLRSDSIESRYSFDWLLEVMADLGVHHLELAGFHTMPLLADGFFRRLRTRAHGLGVQISSVMTAHRECGGLMSGDADLEDAALAVYRRYIEIAALVGAAYVGASAGSIFRDKLALKARAVETYLHRMQGLMHDAWEKNLAGLVIEPMSSAAEPPSTPAEIDGLLGRLAAYHQAHPETTVPVFTCADVSHGIVSAEGELLHDHYELFRRALPYAVSLHVRNTDRGYGSGFGFSEEERRRGVVELPVIAAILRAAAPRLRDEAMVAYLEIPGPKLGRDNQDGKLRSVLEDSVKALREFVALC